MVKNNISTDDLLATIIKGIEDVKGLDIDILDLREIDNRVCDYFVICNGTSNTQVNAIVNSIQKGVSRELKDKPWHVEGTENGEWVLMDYVSIVVHVFQKHIREYYNIEGLWGDAKITSLENKY
ncbi:ribosome silencing factor [Flavobacterium sp.]|jgi:ribosome-associated protein|uniref:ribosome silencing factor n=1 Tax=Flavobacterium sp. TaxID=239 RepID=UPI0025B7B51E|nr:ribosome silencing factor [Flavobacterium sp.]